MRTIYHNRRPLGGELAGGAEWVEFDELLRRADVLSLNLPLNVGLLFTFVLISAIDYRGDILFVFLLDSQKNADRFFFSRRKTPATSSRRPNSPR